MSGTKVLVFESDPAFAAELRNELGRLGAITRVVDDGNVGLQVASTEPPNLILLSIELPRMNGFSVCNKLKKDPVLKDVPLIIMSSESSDETFEQHKKLRTRAEAYVHKPIAFGELLEHIQQYVSLGGDAAPESEGIVIDDEIAIEDVDAEDEGTQMMDRGAMLAAMPAPSAPTPPPPAATDESEVDAFADGAFDALLGPGQPAAPSAPPPKPTARPATAPPPARPATVPPQPEPRSPPPRPSVPPRPLAETGEVERLRAEVAKHKDRASQLERELASVKADAQRAADDPGRDEAAHAEIARLQRELDEVKAKQASGAKFGGVSSREFLDLREALNKKDKEILSLRDAHSRTERELLESKDTSLAAERAKADLDDKLAEVQAGVDTLRREADAHRADKDQASKRAEDFKQRAEKLKTELDAAKEDVAQAKQAHKDEIERVRGELDGERTRTLEELSARTAAATAASEEAHRAALAEATAALEARLENEKRAALAQASEAAGAALAAAVAAKVAELAAAHEATIEQERQSAAETLAERERELAASHAAAHEKHRADHDSALEEARARGEAALADLSGTHAAALAELAAAHAAALAAREDAHSSKAREIERDRDARVEALTTELGALRSEREEAMQSHSAEIAQRDAKIAERDASIAERDATLAERDAKLAALEKELAESQEVRERIGVELAARTSESQARAADLDKARAELGELTDRLAGATIRGDRAAQKWESDKASLERAKDALAAALAQIEEAESRALD